MKSLKKSDKYYNFLSEYVNCTFLKIQSILLVDCLEGSDRDDGEKAWT